MSRAYIGTSGWNYRQWRGSFFPETLPSKQWLSFYASRFDSVEVNYSFYRLPSKGTCEGWYKQTPPRFRFAMKASRYLTHIKRLRDSRESWETFLERVHILKQKLGPILMQFPANFRASAENLRAVDEFLEYAARAGSQRLAFEFRDRSCFGQEMLTLLRKHRAALVISHSSKYPVPEAVATTDFAYFRFHGPKALFASSYSDADLHDWATTMKRFMSTRHDVYAYFNNDSGGHAPRNALALLWELKSNRDDSHAGARKRVVGSFRSR
jgi:uncharacterized protein YecE (DUF72 family)